MVLLEVETSSSKCSFPDVARDFPVSLPVANPLPVQPAGHCQDRVPEQVKDKNLMEELKTFPYQTTRTPPFSNQLDFLRHGLAFFALGFLTSL